MTAALTSIRKAQQVWAEQHVKVDRGCTVALEDNLFRRPMHPETLKEFQRGSGDETGQASTGKRRAKMLSLRSSSVLAVNVFDFWRGRDLTELARALGAEGHYNELKFERPFNHGLASGKPHLDVVLFSTDGRQPLAIESKFAEPYDIKKDGHCLPIDPKYFAGDRQRWTEAGLPRCQVLAKDLGNRALFYRLGAAQLLKHLLGLANDAEGHAGPNRSVSLLYLWFDTSCTEAKEHRDEIEDFRKRLDLDIDFRSMTYQILFGRLAVVAAPDYLDYLRMRYFTPVSSAQAAAPTNQHSP